MCILKQAHCARYMVIHSVCILRSISINFLRLVSSDLFCYLLWS